jgi:Phytanoyl-CoA dioxygenase (PhyH)/SEC-C motif
MDWVVAVSPGETASRELLPATESAAAAAFDKHGCVLLRGALPRSTIEAMHADYQAQFGAMGAAEMRSAAAEGPPNRLLEVGGARYDITLRMTGAFGHPDVFANTVLLKILRPLLGRGMQLSNFTAVVSHPGAPRQHAHRDCAHLFDDAGPSLPVYAVNVAVPLIDVDLETGPTAVWLGSHRFAQKTAVKDADMVHCALERGDCMLLDYRTLHAGLANRGQKSRPIVYMVYARPWFFDDVNHVKRIPLDMPVEDYERLPPTVRPLLIRAFSHAVRSRWHELEAHRRDMRAAKAPQFSPAPAGPAAGKVGRNDPCPCGSGKKYKQCHGAFTVAPAAH